MKIIDFFEEIYFAIGTYENYIVKSPRVAINYNEKIKKFKISNIYLTDDGLILERDLSEKKPRYLTIQEIYESLKEIVINNKIDKKVLFKVWDKERNFYELYNLEEFEQISEIILENNYHIIWKTYYIIM